MYKMKFRRLFELRTQQITQGLQGETLAVVLTNRLREVRGMIELANIIQSPTYIFNELHNYQNELLIKIKELQQGE